MRGDIGSGGGSSADRAPRAGAARAEAGSTGENCFWVSLRGHWSRHVGHKELPRAWHMLGLGCPALRMGRGCGEGLARLQAAVQRFGRAV